ncbi:DNA mismatch repair protein MutT [Sphingobacteriaceae bacterium]|nr:DNA mismatch repair protein MutT [Sphingobacteriaceae bacterium]
MSTYYSKVKKQLVAVDCIAFGFNEDGLKLLIVKRKVEPELGKWSLMGGFVSENESLDDAAKRVLNNLTGLETSYLEQIGTYGEVNRDPGARVISVAYFSLMRVSDYNPELGEKYGAHWVSLRSLPKLIFDHSYMVKAALSKLQEATMIKPVGVRLLPEKFSLLQMKLLYEAIHQKKIDKRNFHKWILSLGILKKTTIKDKSTSKKGTFLYEFNKSKSRDSKL